MTSKRKESIGGLKGTTGGQRREDRLTNSKFAFETITIDAKNVLTVLYMLKSPESNVVLKVNCPIFYVVLSLLIKNFNELLNSISFYFIQVKTMKLRPLGRI